MNLIFGAVLLAVRLQGEVGGIGGGSILYLSISLRWPTRSQCDGVSLLHYGIFTIVNYSELLYFSSEEQLIDFFCGCEGIICSLGLLWLTVVYLC
jgi:hypothetical protein